MRRYRFLLLLCSLGAAVLCGRGQGAWAQSPQGDATPVAGGALQDNYETALVEQILSQQEQQYAGMSAMQEQLKLRITSGTEAGKELVIQNGVLPGRADTQFSPGESVVLDWQTLPDGSQQHVIRDKYRLPSIAWLLAAFVVLSIIAGGITGITSIVGLAVSIAILVWFVIPRIAAGGDPLITCFFGCVAIACTSLYLAHGFNKRTSIAFLSTILTLVLSALMAIASVHITQLFGMVSEESVYLQMGILQNLDLRGLLLGGIIVGCLGVLDDITTAQTAAIDEISKANPSLTPGQLRQAGHSVGKEHIASLINTLALAYVGASLPLLLLLQSGQGYPLWISLNGEFFAEEIIRTLVGSATLLVAVPVSTWLAAHFLQGGGGSKARLSAPPGHSHGKSHHVWVS